MFSLKSVKMHNFQSIVDGEVLLEKQGLYLISGWNDLGGDSNGSGKSTILSAIAFALFNRTVGGIKGSNVATWGSDGTYWVELELTGPEGDYKIHRGSDKLELSIGGTPQKGKKRDVQALINDTFHTNEDIFFSSTLFTSKVSAYLSQMGDDDKKRLFKSILRLEPLDSAYDKAKKEYDTRNLTATKTENEIAVLEDFITTNSNEIIELRRQHVGFEVDKLQRMNELKKEEIEELKPSDLMYQVKTKESIVKDWTGTILMLGEQESKLMLDNSSIDKSLGYVWQEIDTINNSIAEANSLQGATECDKCGAPLGDKFNERISSLYVKQQEAYAKEFKLLNKQKLIESKLLDIQSTYERAEKDSIELEDLRNRLAEEDEKIKENQLARESLVVRQQTVANEPNPYLALLQRAEQEKESLSARYEEAQKNFSKATQEMDLYSYLKLVFSRSGVSAQIIESSFGSLQSIANRYLSKVCTEGLFLNIVPQRELKSKAMKEEIDIYVTTLSRPGLKIPYASLSGGQQQRVNIALLLSLYKFCRNLGLNEFNFLLADEIFDLSLAGKGQEDVIRLMRDILLSEVGQVVIISHQDAVSKDFDYEIEVIRGKDGVSVISPSSAPI